MVRRMIKATFMKPIIAATTSISRDPNIAVRNSETLSTTSPPTPVATSCTTADTRARSSGRKLQGNVLPDQRRSTPLQRNKLKSRLQPDEVSEDAAGALVTSVGTSAAT